MSLRVGIDLGTTFSAVAYIDESSGTPVIIKNRYNKPTTPSVLCFQPDGTILFGDDAKDEQLCGNPNAVSFFKRNMGQSSFALEILGQKYTAADLSAIFLKKLVEDAETQIHQSIDSAVITVPAYFTDKERKDTLEAGKRAGLNVLSLIHEPTAAAFAYGLNTHGKSQTVLIYDLGGGTFDVTIAKITDGEIAVLGSDGDHTLGGKNWDDSLVRYFIDQFEESTGIDMSDDIDMVNTLQVIAEKTKIQLSSRNSVSVPIKYQGERVNLDVTCSIFEDVTSSLIDSTKDLTNNLIASLGLTWNEIDGVILVGGSTRMRMVHDYIVSMSGKPPLSGVNVDEAVALGAAIRANINEHGDVVTLPASGGNPRISGSKAFSDVTAHSLGVILINPAGDRYINSTIIKKNSRIPATNVISSELKTHSALNELEVYVLQGDEERPLDNLILDKYVVYDIEKTSQNPAIIDIAYSYTADGIIAVSAVQKETGKTLPIRVEPVPDDMSWTDENPADHVPKEIQITPTVDVVLAIDVSGSMSGIPIEKAKEAMIGFVNQLNDVDANIGVMAFADSVVWLIKPTRNKTHVTKKIATLSVGYGGAGTCNSAEPFQDSLSELLKCGGVFSKKADMQYVVVLTDGQWSSQQRAITYSHECHKRQIETMAIGFGGADYAFLRRIASTSDFADFSTLTELSGSFSKIAQAINTGKGGLISK